MFKQLKQMINNESSDEEGEQALNDKFNLRNFLAID